MISRDSVKDIPDQPGVYFFMKNKTPIYIGKSVNIRTRLYSHIAQAKLSKKEHAIISQSTKVTYLTTLNNFDAIILEARMIQKHKPQYNVLWKDDKHFLYIKITIKDTYPKIYPVRMENDGSSLYFGPFRSTNMTEKLLYELRRIVPFCTKIRIGKRGCFYSKLGYCNPCPDHIESLTDEQLRKDLRKQYRKNIRKVISILSGKTQSFAYALESRLKELSDQEKYEEAIELRNKLFQFALFLDRRSFDEHATGVNVDVRKLEKQFVAFMKKHYTHITKKTSHRIECYDISNLFGKDPTGSMVVFEDGIFQKKEYRKFHVKRKGISDIHMMEEVISRRLNHKEWRYPDLILLDGGSPQLRHIHRYFQENGIDIPLASIAKRPDRILIPQHNFKPTYVDKNSLLFKLFQSLRDESHRFAKKYHVVLRNRNRLN